MWTEISITVDDGELAEALAEVMGRYIPDGVFIQATGIAYDPDSEGRGIAPYRVGGYLPEDDPETTRKQIETALGHLSLIRPVPEPEYREIEDVDWTESWKVNFRPVFVGETLVILPAWEEAEMDEHGKTASGRIPIRIDPGMAFGTGTHPTTQLALALLEKSLADRAGADVLDIGCGSGILSIAAVQLGAGQVVGVDIDAESIVNAEKNAALNDVSGLLTLAVGSVGEVLDGAFAIQAAPIVVANILAHILVRLIGEGLCGLVSKDGVLILSGILEERELEVVEAAAEDGFSVADRKQEGDWVALAMSRSA